MTIPIVGPLPYTEEWHALRPDHLFASECGRACGVSDHGQPLDVYLEKVGLTDPFEGNEFTARGKRFEPFIAIEYQNRTGCQVETCLPVHFHPYFHFIGATPDARWINDPRHLVEFKACNFRRAAQLGEDETDEIFPDWLMQAQQQMFVMGAHSCDVFVMVDLHTYRLFSVSADSGLQNKMLSALTELWSRIQRRDPPPPDFKQANTLALLQKIHGVDPEKTVQLGHEHALLWLEQSKDRQQLKDLEEKISERKARLLEAMQDAAIGLFPQGLKQLTRSRVNDTLWTEADVSVARQSLGKVKRRGFVRLGERTTPKSK